MTMTPEEICRHYQQAANKSKDISVLADLNATDKASIRAVLIDGGLLQPDKQQRAPKAQKPESLADLAEKVAAGISAGLTNKQIAEKCGCCEGTVKNHRKRLDRAELQKREATRAAGPAPVPQGTLSAACGDIHLAQEAVRPGPSPDTSIYSRLEAILSAIPADAPEDVLVNARKLCSSMLWEYMARRLGVKEG